MPEEKRQMLKHIPAVERLLNTPLLLQAAAQYPRNLILRSIKESLQEIRRQIETGGGPTDISQLGIEDVARQVLERLQLLSRPSLRPVINATGIVIHTNLGRSILADRALKRFPSIGGGYSNLEYTLDEGTRGNRYSHTEGILREITGAEAAMVVNNNAAAVLLSLQTFASGREVIVSRGQLVEIGGSFRVPDVMRKSGAKMVDVGTTNKTHLKDYAEAIGPETAMLLKVHQSNFKIVGFTEEVATGEMAKLAHDRDLLFLEDLGSGCFLDLTKFGLLKEPTVQETLADGADLVTFSGDKLLGGPQAGIILGKDRLVEAVKKNQLARALRIDKLTLLALEETLNIYRDEEAAVLEIPTLRMISQTYQDMSRKARRLMKMVGKPKTQGFSVELVDGSSKVGGGASPLQELPSRLLSLVPKELSVNDIEKWLRSYDPPIISRVEKDRALLDVRTIQDGELKTVAQAVNKLAEAIP
jgi:L-seryl-tRNA(Ser) seleniumtransferase